MAATMNILQTPSGASRRGSHQLACVSECARQWVFRYRRRIVSKDEPDWRLCGTVIHDAVAYRYSERMHDMGHEWPSWWTGETLDEVIGKSGSGKPHIIQTAREVADAYPEYWWASGAETWEPIAVEEEFQATVGELDPDADDKTLDDEVVTCGTDLVVRDVKGDLWAVDHKTKSLDWRTKRMAEWDPDGAFALSWQAYINLHILRKRYPHDTVRGFIVNRISRQKPYGFDRYVLPCSDMVYTTVPRVIRAQVAEELRIDGMLRAGEAPVPSYWHCDTKFGPCDYRRLCNADSAAEANAIRAIHYVGRE